MKQSFRRKNMRKRSQRATWCMPINITIVANPVFSTTDFTDILYIVLPTKILCFVCVFFVFLFFQKIKPVTFNCYTGKTSAVCLKDINPVQDTCWNRRNVTSDNLQRITASTHSKPPGNKWCWPHTLQLLPQSPQFVCAVQPPNCKKHHAIKKSCNSLVQQYPGFTNFVHIIIFLYCSILSPFALRGNNSRSQHS